MVISYSSIKVDLNEMNINSGYTDISLEFDQDASYNLEIRHTNSFASKNEKD